ncbi:hypothetical protein F5878DRAFT_193750 [Lentinula raphanica]|uniref:Uncharacterized protein n=1 Tax=Lentinula raphanica TaxID=153919 RepID=A0AA38UMC8_9AGAR|nr:hypothetical protein F5878DRAFT_193750 [Lentinula raphanica]
MLFTATALAYTTIHIFLWTGLCVNGAPLPFRPRASSTNPLSTRDTTNSTSTNGTTSLTPTLRDDVQSILSQIGPDAESRFVNLNTPTAFGANDPVQSNHDLSQLVDRAFLPGQVRSGNNGWVDTYVQCLIDVANTLPSLDNQTTLINAYFDAMRALAPAQARLVEAYKVAKNETTTNNIGVELPGRLVDALTMQTVDEWAAEVFNGSGSEDQSGTSFDSKDYKDYLNLNASYTEYSSKFNKLETANKIASEGWLLREMINKSPAIFNLSMITAGDPSSSSAQYSAAWSATIINSASVVVSGIGDNLDNGFHDGTTNSTTYATSINNEAPASTSVGFSPTSSSDSISPTQISDSSFGTITQSTSTSTSTPSPSATLTSGPARRSRLRRARISPPTSPIHRRALSASNALLIAASAGSSSETRTTTAHADSTVLPGMKQAASAASFVEEPANAEENVTFVPLSSTSTQTSFSTSATSVTGVPDSTNTNTSDPLSNVPDVPLQTTASLFAMSLQEGAWANNRAAFLPFISQHHPDIYQKYFGNGTTGDGILGRRWTHVLLLVTVKANSTEIETSEVVGMVYGVIPGLTAVQGSSADGDSVSDSGSSDEGSDDDDDSSTSATSSLDS